MEAGDRWQYLSAMGNIEIREQGFHPLCADHIHNYSQYVIISIALRIYSDDKHTAILIKGLDRSGKHYQVYRPNTGRQAKTEKLSALPNTLSCESTLHYVTYKLVLHGATSGLNFVY